MDYRVRIAQTWDDFRLVVAQDEGAGVVRVASGFEWVEHRQGDMYGPDDGIGLARPLIQKIMDEAWEHGFRPSGFSDVKNETAAIKGHLSDMRAIAFHKLGMKADT